MGKARSRPASAAPLVDGRGKGVSSHETPLDARFVVSERASFMCRGTNVVVRIRGNDDLATFPLGVLRFVSHFATPRTIVSALLIPGVIDPGSTDQSVSLLRDLIAVGALEAVPSSTPSGAEAMPDIWSKWSAALDFYLDTRTVSDTPYISVDDLEIELRSKTSRRKQPSAFKDYFEREFIPLERPLERRAKPGQSAEILDVLLARRTTRRYDAAPLSGAALSRLLYYTWGATRVEPNRMGDFFLKKTSPSGGSLHTAEVYPVLMNVEGFRSGIYHYSVRRHGLELLSAEDPRAWIVQACGDQAWIGTAAAVFVSTARLERMAWKYEFSRALRIVLLDIGHLSQTFSLVATALRLGSFTTGALRDEMFERKLGLQHLEEPVFLVNGVGPALNMPTRRRLKPKAAGST